MSGERQIWRLRRLGVIYEQFVPLSKNPVCQMGANARSEGRNATDVCFHAMSLWRNS